MGSFFPDKKSLGLIAPPSAGGLGSLSGHGSLAGGPGLLSLVGPVASSSTSALGSLLAGGSWTGRTSLSLPGVMSPPLVTSWQFVRRRFGQFLTNLAISDSQREDGETRSASVRACLNRHYWSMRSETANSFLIGSWGKHTHVRPARDVDVLFLLPDHVYHRFQKREGNRQSQLLQEMKDVLAVTYSRTAMRGDGQVVMVPFDTTPIEVAPGFRCTDGSVIICDTNGGGRYRTSTAEAEARALAASDTQWNGNTRALVRMMKRWQRERNVPLKSFQIERLAIEFLASWPNGHHDLFWYDWMVRDFFDFLIGRVNTHLVMPGTGEWVWLGSDWLSCAQTAHRYAVSACEYEHGNHEVDAGLDWREIFGAAVNVIVS